MKLKQKYGYNETQKAGRRRKALKKAVTDFNYDKVISSLQSRKYQVKDYKMRRIQADINYLKKRKKSFETGFTMELDLQL
ncbi:MAG: hypothetical protein ABEJ93_02785 [Candidatus Nanohalobium sp.]